MANLEEAYQIAKDDFQKASVLSAITTTLKQQSRFFFCHEKSMSFFKILGYTWVFSNLKTALMGLIFLVGGIFVEATGLFFGSVKGAKREKYDLLADHLDTATMPSIIAARNLQAISFAFWGYFITNRLGINEKDIL